MIWGDIATSGASLLEKESMDYIAISFSEADVTGEKDCKEHCYLLKVKR